MRLLLRRAVRASAPSRSRSPGSSSSPPGSPGSHGCPATFVSGTVSAVDGIAQSESGLASGLINTTQQIGGALGLAVLSAVATGRTDSVAGDAGPGTALNEGFQAGLLVAAGLALVAALLTAVVTRGSEPAPAHSSAESTATAAPDPA